MEKNRPITKRFGACLKLWARVRQSVVFFKISSANTFLEWCSFHSEVCSA